MAELTFDPVFDLVDALQAADVRAAEDPADLNLPGAWVTVDQITPANMAGALRLECLVFLIVDDTDYKRALGRLAVLYNKVRTVLLPDGPVRPQAVLLPGDTTPLPALRVPVHLFDN